MHRYFGVLLFLGISYAVPLSENQQFNGQPVKPAFIQNSPTVVPINPVNYPSNSAARPINKVIGAANIRNTSINQDISQVNSSPAHVSSVTSEVNPSASQINQIAGQFNPNSNQVNSVSGQVDHATDQANHLTGHTIPVANQVNSVSGQDNHVTGQTNHMAGQSIPPPGQVNNTTTSQQHILGHLISEFGLEMCDMIYLNGEEDNIVFSPLSIATLLTLLMAGMGKQSQTYYETDELMGYNKADEEFIHQLYQQFLDESSIQENNVSFSIGNKLYLQGDDIKGVQILGSFTKTAKENYNASIETVDFLSDPFGAANRINEWVKSVTNGKIPQVLAGPLDPQTKFMAVNTVYFKAPWKTPFETLANRMSTFDTGREKLDMTFMTQIMDVKIHQLINEAVNATIVEIPYTSERYSMFIIKPKGPASLDSVIQVEYAINSINSLVEETKSKPVLSASVQIPRMRLSSKTYLKGVLEKMGAKSMFSPENADFSRITMNNQPIMNNMIHEAVIDITEEGTEAAAVTSSLIWKGGTSLSFVLDQPSIIFIYDSKTKVPIFWARLVTPESIYQINPVMHPSNSADRPINQVIGAANPSNTSINQDISQVNSSPAHVSSVTSQVNPSASQNNQIAGQFNPDLIQINSVSGQVNNATVQDNHLNGQTIPVANQVNSVAGQDNHVTGQTNHMAGQYFPTQGQVNNTTTSQEQILGHLISKFGLEMCEKIYLNGEQDTIVFSPLSIATLLTLLMAGMGKQSQTYYETDELMGYNKADEEFIHQLYQKFLDDSSIQENNVSFSIGNKLFLQGDDIKGVQILGSFTKTAHENYNASIETVDFLSDPFGAANSINEWVKSVTNGKIPQVLAGPLDPATKFMAINTVYFKAPWQTPFETMANRIATFNTGREKLDMTFMTQIMDVKIHQLINEDATMVEIPYTSERYSMFIIKPNGPAGLGSVIQVEYAINSINTLVEETKSKPVLSASVQIPRMRLSSKTYLKNVLEKMGAKSMFSPENADFSRITINNQPIMNNMIHEAVIDITEEGTEAAAVTSSLIWKGGTSLSFVLDQPSIIFIYDSKTKVPIFWARLITPESI